MRRITMLNRLKLLAVVAMILGAILELTAPPLSPVGASSILSAHRESEGCSGRQRCTPDLDIPGRSDDEVQTISSGNKQGLVFEGKPLLERRLLWPDSLQQDWVRFRGSDN